MTKHDILFKFHRAYIIIKVMIRLNKISEDIRKYGTSSNLYDLNKKNRQAIY